ncbi:hypothetical protein FQ186_22405 [Pseudomonas sp. ANT_H14]|uniref:HNH endonuclease n=1 Tax=unclassified Pseudomonas TaxID=196821 RepID=UPI0011EE17E4|nr:MULTISPECIES: HNH endonuclease [unclassified Pseudomonas]KAA0943261.1 hypothetical protein FQ182_25915 [Pseudomonas sp. ANT_H4]KAA0949854.1 hypothetical protein FQ186_22405 [Pseudomonas sp. ANT_H14]
MTSKVKITPLPPIEILEARYKLVDSREGILTKAYKVSPKSRRVTYEGSLVGSVTNNKGRRQAQVEWEDDTGRHMVRVQTSRIVYRMAYGPFDEALYVDHIDGDPSHNHPSNLRTCTAKQNMQNAKRRDTKADGLPKGISAYGTQFAVDINIGDGDRGVVLFENIRAATRYADQIRKRFHGEFARNG